MEKNNKITCSRCVMDSTVPGIMFDEQGMCNYCKIHDTLDREYPQGTVGKQNFDQIVQKIKQEGQKGEYDCVIGVSGGTDSCYLLHLAKEVGLRPLAVNLDNGWSSEIAVSNIKKCTSSLGIDLRTYVIDWEEVKDVLCAFLMASLPWADAPTDIAITAALYKVAAQENIRSILIGADFRTEGKQPSEWTYCDGRMMKSILNRYGKKRLKSFPILTISSLLYYGLFRRIKNIRPLYYLEYDKIQARKLLEEKYDWKYYGGHHYESVYTNFVLRILLPEKFGADKRKVTYSAQIRSGLRPRGDCLQKLAQPPCPTEEREQNIQYVMKKLGLSAEQFDLIMKNEPKSIYDYPSYLFLLKHFRPIVQFFLKMIIPWTPTTLREREVRGVQ